MTSSMASVIEPRSDQINSDDLISGPRTIRIAGVDIRPGTEQPVSIKIDGDGKVWRPCKSMSRVLVSAWGADAKEYVGRSVTLYRDPTVKWGGLEVGGIRISHLSNIDRDMVMALTATKGQRKPYTVKVLQASGGGDIDAARSAIANASDLDALRRVWASAAMRPFRDALQADLDQRKAELSMPSANDQAGEPTTLASAMAELDTCATEADVNAVVAANSPLLDDADAASLAGYGLDRVAALRGEG